MPGSLPGDTDLNNGGNPNAGRFVIMDPLSGPKDTPFAGADGNLSTGGLSTGIGFGCNHVIGAGGIAAAGFNDDYTPGVTKPDGTASADSTLMYIGGGRSLYTGAPNPYTTGFAICGAGNGGSRDSGANTGFGMKMVTATGDVANGAAIEAGFVNRSGEAMVNGQSAFGSASVANAVAS